MADVPDVAGKAGNLVTKQVGPLPVWAYAVLIGGGLGVTFYLNRNKGGGGGSTPTGAGDGTVDATGSGTYVPAGGNIGGGSSSGGSGSAVPQFSDNNAWGTAAINYLVTLGSDPGIANQAISKYLASEALTPQQQAMVNSAIQHFGSPPLIVTPVQGGNPETPTPKTPAWDNASRGNVTAANDGNWQDVFGQSHGKHLIVETGYGRSVKVKQVDFWGPSFNGQKTGVGGGVGWPGVTVESDIPLMVPVPDSAIGVSMRYEAAEGFAAEVV